MKHLRVLLPLALLVTFFSSHAQEDDSTSEENNTLVGQFEELERKSGNYRANGIRYEVIKLSDLYEVKNNIFDSINTANKSIKDLSATITGNEAQIEDLNTKLQDTTNKLNTVTEEKDSISFFGALISKGTYNFILWAIIFALLLFLLFFIYRFRNSNFLTHQAKSALADLEKEYEDHRRRALEREQKISRQLQDELNKQKK
ncbi:MAG: tRNA (guanine-N1)-methyltransferase [Flavobacteriaceae bacterium]|jgi:preprotein translocase subunit SecF|uniref:tRNA (guanine-N1)-methyltransferase n=1 Tax=Flagellimonas TaxID=444459 RepID=UPI0025D92931|nr:tRNA (guanine-N1)-methyltransferase [Allomuricauda sp.]MCR9262792.1 tRNA (guanine-N1)-methyltransferase [Flavobacteriaceae bacterium]